MNEIFFTDMDGTILNNGKCPNETKETLDRLNNENITAVLTTWKWLPRIDSTFQTPAYNHKILENWSRIVMPWHEQILTLIEWEYLMALNEIFNKIKERISFLFFYPIDTTLWNWIFYIRNATHPKLQKFKKIMTSENSYNLGEFAWYIQKWRWITMVNICVEARNLEELWLPDTYKWLNLVFNEWMLNISTANKWIGIEKLLQKMPQKVSKILVAGNDINDIPAFDRVMALSYQWTVAKTWIIVVGNLIPENLLRKYAKITHYRVPSPEEISSPIKTFFNI